MNSLAPRNHVGRMRDGLWPALQKRRSAADGAPHLLADQVKNVAPLRQDRAERVEIMDHAVVTDMIDRNACGDELGSIGIAFVAYWIEFGGVDDGAGKSGEFRRTQRRDSGIGEVCI